MIMIIQLDYFAKQSLSGDYCLCVIRFVPANQLFLPSFAVSRLTKRVTSSETEKEEMERELEETKHKYKDVKHRYDQVLLDSGSRMTVQDHINTVADLKK